MTQQALPAQIDIMFLPRLAILCLLAALQLRGKPTQYRGLEDYIAHIAPPELSEHIQDGMDPDVLDSASGEPALVIAARLGRLDIMKVLIDHEANIDLAGPDKCSALTLAANYEKVEAVLLLLCSGAAVANSSCAKFSFETPVASNGVHMCPRIIADWAEGISPGEGGGDGWTALHWACVPGIHECGRISQLLREGADANAITLHGFTPLMAAVQLSCCSATDSLLAAGADPNAVEAFSGESVLQIACLRAPTARAVRSLLEAGADVGHKNNRHIGVPYRARYNKGAQKEEIVQLVDFAIRARRLRGVPMLGSGSHKVRLLESLQSGANLSGRIYVYRATVDVAGYLELRIGSSVRRCQEIQFLAGAVRGFKFECSVAGLGAGRAELVITPDPSVARGDVGISGIYAKEIIVGYVDVVLD